MAAEAYPMKGGDGPNSYAKNSTLQKGAVDAAKELINEEIAEKLDTEILLSSNTFNIADMGCSVGPNTFIAVENIHEAVKSKYQCQGGSSSQIPEFQVFFNDHSSNDFNMLFKSLSPNRQYYAAGVPGSFYGRVFPNSSIHIVHSSYSIQWLSRVPKELLDKNSPAWNKGRIHYLNSTDEVIRAYKNQYTEDMKSFLNARAQEIVCGGLLVLIIIGIPHGTNLSQTYPNAIYQLLGSCLMDMARKGIVSEEKVDSFNLPVYHMSPQELEAAVERNGCFNIERMENLPDVQLATFNFRAVLEEVIKQHFGDEILDELFDLFRKKLEVQPSMFQSREVIVFLAVLKRKEN